MHNMSIDRMSTSTSDTQNEEHNTEDFVDDQMLQKIKEILESKFEHEMKRKQDELDLIEQRIRECTNLKNKLTKVWNLRCRVYRNGC